MFEEGKGTVARLRNRLVEKDKRIVELEALISPDRQDSLPLSEIIAKQGRRIEELEAMRRAALEWFKVCAPRARNGEPYDISSIMEKLAESEQDRDDESKEANKCR